MAATGELPGVLVERKAGVAVVLHWRQRPEMADRSGGLGRPGSRPDGPGAAPGEDGGRAAAAGPRRQGDRRRGAVRRSRGRRVRRRRRGGPRRLRRAGPAPGRRSAPAHALRIAVRSAEEPPELVARADVQVDGPAGLATLLADLAAADYECACLSWVSSHAAGGLALARVRSSAARAFRSSGCHDERLHEAPHAVCTTSNGCTLMHACSSTSCAPASRERQSTPSRRLASGPSSATRFSPSRTGFTSSTSLQTRAGERTRVVVARVEDHRLPVAAWPNVRSPAPRRSRPRCDTRGTRAATRVTGSASRRT